MRFAREQKGVAWTPPGLILERDPVASFCRRGRPGARGGLRWGSRGGDWMVDRRRLKKLTQCLWRIDCAGVGGPGGEEWSPGDFVLAPCTERGNHQLG